MIVQAGPSSAKDEMYRFSPGGVNEIDAKTVVSKVPATRYEVLPQQAGLVQLLASGALKQNSLGEYIVREKIRFPAGTPRRPFSHLPGYKGSALSGW